MWWCDSRTRAGVILQATYVMPAGQSASARTSSPCPVPPSPGPWGCLHAPEAHLLEKAQAAFLGWPDPISSPVGGAPRSGVCINLEARNKDERDPGEKAFLHISIYNTSAPPTGGSTFSTEAPLCVLGSLSLGTFHRVCSWGNEFRVGDWMHGACCVSVCGEIRGCCRYGFGFIVSPKIKWGH